MKQHTQCLNCDCLVEKKDEKWWRWSGWIVYGSAPSAPPREVGKKLDEWDFLFHKECFQEWIDNRNGFLQDLDRPVNNCVYFQRTGSSIHGYYVRDGKKHACLAAWTEYDITGKSITPTIVSAFRLDFDHIEVVVKDNVKFLESFRNFLNKNGWFNEGWYEPRKPFEVKEAVANRMKAKYNGKKEEIGSVVQMATTLAS